MTWLLFKHNVQKSWVWAKNNWKILALLVYTLVLYLLFNKNTENAKKILDDAREAHKAEVDKLNKSHSELIKRREENQKKYIDLMKRLEEETKKRNEAITFAKKKRVKQIVEEAGDDPEKLAELVKDTFGFEVVESE
tara:strand:+ start:3355 stop:3765 length:411 start_codon:yes stop_codon:yes gene_type:complete